MTLVLWNSPVANAEQYQYDNNEWGVCKFYVYIEVKPYSCTTLENFL